VTPDLNSTMVFNIGTLYGLNIVIDIGGHFIPSSMFTVRLECSNIQKNEKKNKISEVINKIIPNFMFFSVFFACSPCMEASRAMSCHHLYGISIIKISVVVNKILFLLKNIWVVLIIISMDIILALRGQGL
jgi:hypothetical protein